MINVNGDKYSKTRFGSARLEMRCDLRNVLRRLAVAVDVDDAGVRPTRTRTHQAADERTVGVGRRSFIVGSQAVVVSFRE